MKRTYRSKKETGGGLDPRDVILTLDSKNSLFDAFYIQNIKQTKRELSIAPTTVPFAVSNKVRKRKYVKRLKEEEPIIRESTSRSVFLTPDKSFRVNKAPDLFDQLLNSSYKTESTDSIRNINSNNRLEGRTCCRRKGLKKKTINRSSSDSTDSDKENSNISTDNVSKNSSDILSHKLLIEKEKQPNLKIDESIANIVNNLSLFRETKDKISISPRGPKKTRNSRLLELNQISPLCSTPLLDKYRGKSIYNFSPISINLNNSSNVTETEINGNDNDNSLIILKDESFPRSDIIKQENIILNEIKNKSIKEIQDSGQFKSPILPNRTNIIKTKLICNSNDPKFNNSSLQTTELEPFLGFSNVNILTDVDIEAISNKCKNIEKDILIIHESFEQINESHLNNNKIENSDEENSTNYNKTKIEEDNIINNSLFKNINAVIDNNVTDRSTNNSNIEINYTDSSITNEENGSLYDTCNSEDIEELSDKEPVVIVERLNDSIFQNYYEKIANYSSHSLNDDDPGDQNSEVYASMKDIPNISSDSTDVSEYGNNEGSTHSENNNSEENISNTSDEIVDNENTEYKPDEDVFVSFVTTRRGKEIRNDSFIFDNSLISTSSGDINKTVFSNNNINTPNGTLIEEDKALNMSSPHIDPLIEKRYSNETNLTLSNTQNIDITNKNKPEEYKKLRKSPIIKRKNSITNHKQNSLKKERRGSINNNSLNSSKSSLNIKTNNSKESIIPKTCDLKQGIVLQPGKRWERSLSIYRRMTVMGDHFDHSILDDESLHNKGRKYRQSVISTMEMQDYKGSVLNESINSRRSTFFSKPERSTIRIVKDDNTSRSSLCSTLLLEKSQGFLTEDCDDTIIELSKLSIADSEHEVTVLEKFHDTSNRFATARDYVLRRCSQTDVILFDECYPDAALKNCRKIGEGVYGEVFLWRAADGRARVLKVIPIAGNVKVNGEDQKGYEEIISEIVIAMELSALRAPIEDIEKHFDEGKGVETLDLHSVENASDVFNEVLAVRCVYGSYPSRLLDLWELYDECKGSENDNPVILPFDQQYIVLELSNAGQDLESYQFNNAEQAYALFRQIAFGLAVAEESYQFEHRDLHWGNVLISPTDQKYATFVLRGRAHRVARRGVRAALIDYSLSRAAPRAPRRPLYHDLARDDALFDAVGDYQFEVYRLMRDKLGNDWKNFEPYTNILWLHYTVDKMITALRYTRTNTKVHKHYIAKLKEIKNRILDYGNAVQYVLTDNEF